MKLKKHTLLITAGALAIVSLMFAACGTDDDDEKSTTATTYTFSADIAPILTASCASNNACHASTNTVGNTVYVDNKANLVAGKTNVINRMNGTGAIMPPSSSGVSLSAANKQKIEDYLNQTTQN